jgi:hypothetical protein
VSGSELIGIGTCALTFSLWIFAAEWAIDLKIVLFFIAFCFGCVVSGRLCCDAVVPRSNRASFPTVFLFGFFCVSVPLFLLSVLSPLGMAWNGLIVVLITVVWGLARTPLTAQPITNKSEIRLGLATTLLSLVAATLWSADSIQPMTVAHGMVTFRPWVDSFYHSCVVRMFRDSHGFSSLEHIMLPGQPAAIYHYASYSAPAFMAAVTKTPCYLALTSFQVPLGVVLTGFAAFSLIKSWWGPGAGLAATVFLLFLPDASVYGLKNPYLSYHWLQQIAPAGGYGVALAAISWLLLFEGCRSRRYEVIGLSFLVAGAVLFYKAHIFVANAFLIWVLPPILVSGFRPLRRAVWFAFAVVFFLAIVSLAKYVPAAPVLRMDGSGLRQYVNLLALNLGESPLKTLLSPGAGSRWIHDLYKGVIHLLFGTFGVMGPVCLLLAWPIAQPRAGDDRIDRDNIFNQGSRRVCIGIAVFPLLLIANYLVMALGLAPDENNVSASDELMHRPLVWAYFGVSAWVGGALYRTVIRQVIHRYKFARTVFPAVLSGLIAVPFLLGTNVQVGPEWAKELTNTSMPIELFQCSSFLREHGRVGELVQDSARDPLLALGALSEHPEFAIDYFAKRMQLLLAGQLRDIESLEQMIDRDQIRRYADERHLCWYVLHPRHHVGWPPLVVDNPAFTAGGFRVYRLSGPER